MPTPLPTEAREALVTALGTTYEVFPVVPPIPTPGTLVIACDAPWIVPSRLPAVAAEINLKVLCVARDNAEGIAQLEQMVFDVLDAITGLYTAGSVTAPQTLDLGAQGTVLVAEVPVSIHVKE